MSLRLIVRSLSSSRQVPNGRYIFTPNLSPSMAKLGQTTRTKEIGAYVSADEVLAMFTTEKPVGGNTSGGERAKTKEAKCRVDGQGGYLASYLFDEGSR